MNKNSVRTNLENSCPTFVLDIDSYPYIKQSKIGQNINCIYTVHTIIQHDGQDRTRNKFLAINAMSAANIVCLEAGISHHQCQCCIPLLPA